jgi:hypothetical protein
MLSLPSSFQCIGDRNISLFRENCSQLCYKSLNVEDQVSVLFSSDRVAELYSHAPGSLFLVFYDSQGNQRAIIQHLDLL